MRSLAAIALGSNLESSFGDREANLGEAVRLIRPLGEVTAVSSFYDTEPVGFLEQPRFLNGALLLETESGALGVVAGVARGGAGDGAGARGSCGEGTKSDRP